MGAASKTRDLTSELAFLTRALKAPSMREAVPRLAERARAESWSHEEFLAACLAREVSSRESHGGEGRIRAARFPARKSIEEFDFDHARGLRREVISHLGTLDFIPARENVVFLGPPGTGKTHLGIGLGAAACAKGYRVRFYRVTELVTLLIEARDERALLGLKARLGKLDLLVLDEFGYVPASKVGAELLFDVISSAYERTSLIVTTNLPFDHWTEVLGSERLTGATLDRLTHRCQIIETRGESYRLRDAKARIRKPSERTGSAPGEPPAPEPEGAMEGGSSTS